MPQTLPSLIGFLVVIAVCVLTTFVGRGRERIASLSLLASVFVSVAIHGMSTTWDPVWPLAAVDVAVLAVFVAVAWRPRRGWPLWAVALQGLTVAIDGLRAAEIGMGAYTYILAVNLSTYGLAVVIAYAGWQAWRSRRHS